MRRDRVRAALWLLVVATGCGFDFDWGGGGEQEVDPIPSHPGPLHEQARWEATLCLDQFTKINRLATAPDGDVVVAGRACTSNSSGCRLFVARLDPEGEVRWTTVVENEGDDLPMALLPGPEDTWVVPGNDCSEPGCRPWLRTFAGTGEEIDEVSLPPGEITDAVALGDHIALSTIETCELYSGVCGGTVRIVDGAGQPVQELLTGAVRELESDADGGLWLLETASGDGDGMKTPTHPDINWDPADLLVRRVSATGGTVWTARLDDRWNARPRRLAARPDGSVLVLAEHGAGDDGEQSAIGLHRIGPAGDALWSRQLFVTRPDQEGDEDILAQEDVKPRDLAVAPDGRIAVLFELDTGPTFTVWHYLDAEGRLRQADWLEGDEGPVTPGAVHWMGPDALLVAASPSREAGKIGWLARFSAP